MTVSIPEKAKELCPHWFMSERAEWISGFIDGAGNYAYLGESEQDDFSLYSYGYRAGKTWLANVTPGNGTIPS